MKKLLALLMTVVMAFGMFVMTACGGNKPASNTEADLEIFHWDAGNGSEWLRRTIAAFKEKFPEVNVIEKFSEINDSWQKELTDTKNNTVDLYISTMTNFLAYTDYIEPLDDIFNEKWGNESKTLLEKNDQFILDSYRGEDGKLYASTYGGGVCGIVYNKTVFDQKGYKIPRTTQELAALAGNMVDDKYTPFIHCNNADYWLYAVMPWAAQYGGIDEVYNFWQAKYVDPETGAVSQPDIRALTTEGREKALEALYDVIAPDGYTYSASNQKSHTDAQTLFLSERALMMPNGSWLENEMRNTKTNIEFAFMKLPVISSLADKLGIEDDYSLAEIVSYVDSADYAAGTVNNASSEYDAAIINEYSKDVIDAVAEARKITYSEAISNRAIIPNYANGKEWAKKFIQFMNSDEALAIYTDELHVRTTVTPTTGTVDTSKWSVFMKSADALMQNASYVYRAKSYKLFYFSSAINEFWPSISVNYPAADFTASNPKDQLTAGQYWQKCKTYYNSYWDSALTQAGLK